MRLERAGIGLDAARRNLLNLRIEELVARFAVDALHVDVLTRTGLASGEWRGVGSAGGQLLELGWACEVEEWRREDLVLPPQRLQLGRGIFLPGRSAASICQFRLRLIHRANVGKPVPLSSAVSRWLLPFTRTSCTALSSSSSYLIRNPRSFQRKSARCPEVPEDDGDQPAPSKTNRWPAVGQGVHGDPGSRADRHYTASSPGGWCRPALTCGQSPRLPSPDKGGPAQRPGRFPTMFRDQTAACWRNIPGDPAGLAIVDYRRRFERLPRAAAPSIERRCLAAGLHQ
jgi:hypothetical protein